MGTTVRYARLDDIPVLIGLMREFYGEHGMPLDPAHAARTFGGIIGEASLGRVWVLERGGEPAGYAVLALGYSMEYGGRDGFVDDLFVRASHRRRGAGRAALEALLAECRALGIRALHLEVDRANAAAKALYARFGFRDNARQLLTVRLADSPTGA